MHETENTSQAERIADWWPWREWRAKRAANLFATDAAWEWFARKHKGELIDSGTYMPTKGRKGGLVRVDGRGGPSIDSVVINIKRREVIGGDEAA